MQDDCRAVGELPQDQGGVHLTGRLRAEAARGRERSGGSTAPSFAIRMNGVRSARSVRSSSAAAELNRSQKPADRLPAGEYSG
jgi:hypothetical protein